MSDGTANAMRDPSARHARATTPIPAFVNPKAGTAAAATTALEAAGGFAIHEVEPTRLPDAVRGAVASGATRVLVAGGDGSIGLAASALAGSATELAVLPGGTLNHFAKDAGIPADLDEAARVASVGAVRSVDAAYVGERLFLNTSSVGAYVTFVRMRERLERFLGYRIASFLAALRVLVQLRRFHVELETDGVAHRYHTALVFVGVGERELQAPKLGARIEGGRRGLHVLVVHSRSAARLVSVGLAAVARGLDAAARTPDLDSFVVDRCTIDLGRSHHTIAVDGELIKCESPIEYRIARDALRVVVDERDG